MEGFGFVQGLASLNLEAFAKANSDELKFSNGSYSILVKPLLASANESISINYLRLQQPPLTVMDGIECDFGEIALRIRFLATSESKSHELMFFFRFEAGGRLSAIDSISEVPRFNDNHLNSLLEEGKITQDESNLLRSYSSTTRYRAARSDNTSENYLDFPNHLRILLKRL